CSAPSINILARQKDCNISRYPSMKKMRLNNAPVILYYQIGCVEHVLQHIVGASTADETRRLTHAGSFMCIPCLERSHLGRHTLDVSLSPGGSVHLPRCDKASCDADTLLLVMDTMQEPGVLRYAGFLYFSPCLERSHLGRHTSDGSSTPLKPL